MINLKFLCHGNMQSKFKFIIQHVSLLLENIKLTLCKKKVKLSLFKVFHSKFTWKMSTLN